MALELARLYASGWEHELYFARRAAAAAQDVLLQSHTVETGAQETTAERSFQRVQFGRSDVHR
jgi:hypothetical protein